MWKNSSWSLGQPFWQHAEQKPAEGGLRWHGRAQVSGKSEPLWWSKIHHKFQPAGEHNQIHSKTPEIAIWNHPVGESHSLVSVPSFSFPHGSDKSRNLGCCWCLGMNQGWCITGFWGGTISGLLCLTWVLTILRQGPGLCSILFSGLLGPPEIDPAVFLWWL